MSADDYMGPTADDLLPAKRLNPDALYSEHLITLFGERAALSGVALEIVDAQGGSLITQPGSARKTAATRRTIWIWFKNPAGSGLLSAPGEDGTTGVKKLGINATIKKSLTNAFETSLIACWVGWVTLYVDPNVEDKKTGALVRAIRTRDVRPDRAPTFDYSANVRKRVERDRAALARARSGAGAQTTPSSGSPPSSSGSAPPDAAEAAEIAASESAAAREGST